jgi:hypothetical protein
MLACVSDENNGRYYQDFTLGALYEKLLELLPEQRRGNTPTRLVIS